MDYAKESLRLHEQWGGKIEVNTRVPVSTKDDLSLAYTPGVAQPCLEIQRDPDKSYTLTRPAQSLRRHHGRFGRARPWRHRARRRACPSWRASACCSKAFADVDAFPLCIRTKDVDEFVRTVYLLSGKLRRHSIWRTSPRRAALRSSASSSSCATFPAFHDDQHGTAIITLAGLTKRAARGRQAPRGREDRPVRRRRGRHFHQQAAAERGRARRDAL